MSNNGYLSVGEFQRGIEGLHRRLDRIDTKQDEHGELLAVHGKRLNDLERGSSSSPRRRVPWGSIGAGAAAVVAVFKGFFTYVK